MSLCCRTKSWCGCESRRGPVARPFQREQSCSQDVTDPDHRPSPARRQAEMRWCVACALLLRLFRSAKNIAVLIIIISSYHAGAARHPCRRCELYSIPCEYPDGQVPRTATRTASQEPGAHSSFSGTPSQSRSFANFPPSVTVAKVNAPAGEGMEGLAAACADAKPSLDHTVDTDSFSYRAPATESAR